MQSTLTLTSFYKFQPLNNPEILADSVRQTAEQFGAKGLILLGHEGINGSACLPSQNIHGFQNFLRSHFQEMTFKDSPGTPSAFLKLKVKLRPEIVTMGTPDLRPHGPDGHVSPQEWDTKMKRGAQILDVRNDYEIRIGKFHNAQDLHLEDFSEFPQKLRNSALDKNRETLIYCTGGIRCEKAILEMKRQGFTQVAQLEGGILKYLEEYGPRGQFDGECFVFDYRVALDTSLTPSDKHRLCPHCGEPTAHLISCHMCQTQQHVCDACLKIDEHHNTCSKNCAHHSRMGHRSRKRQESNTHMGKAPR